MKMNKFFMLGLAGLAFAACSNEEDAINNGAIDGAGAVSIKIVNPALTRAIDPATPDGTGTVTVVPTGNVIITLAATTGNGTIELTPEEWMEGKEVTFWNVTNPTGVTVTMNEGVSDYSAVNITNGTPELQVLPENIPVYGSATITAANLTGNEDTPISANDDHETGATQDDVNNGTVFQMYEATVNLTIPVARLEVSNITKAEGNFFNILTLGGVYMDNLKATGSAARANYYFVEGEGIGTGVSPLKTVIDPAENFLAENGVWPGKIQVDNEEVDGAYAFNFYGATAEEIAAATTSDAKQALNPKFKLYFPTATSSSEEIQQPRYAMITKYYTQGEDGTPTDVVMQNGHIYRITDVALDDDYIIPNEDGEEVFGVAVTVVEATWEVVDIEAEWAGQ